MKVFILAVVVSLVLPIRSYRIAGTKDESLPFAPYEKGFIDNTVVGDIHPTSPNPGYSNFSAEKVGKSRLQSCLEMVGPFNDDKFYCRGKEFGYCDRRSGTCFCNRGYSGKSCEICDSNHHRLGNLCYQNQRCPNDCSSFGKCDNRSGKCECNEYREGLDCSEFKCSIFDPHCIHCKEQMCIQCSRGFSLDNDSNQCEPCRRFDPRCTTCDENKCLDCNDLLLQSSRRSGVRQGDVIAPPDEVHRELSNTLPFGTLQSNAFDDSETYFIVESYLTPLNESASRCEQSKFDSSFACHPLAISNLVCGHNGVFTFESPEYDVDEDQNQVRISIHRSGGGAGTASISYGLSHISTDKADWTNLPFHITEQTLTFHNHQVQKSFLLPINDDLKNVRKCAQKIYEQQKSNLNNFACSRR